MDVEPGDTPAGPHRPRHIAARLEQKNKEFGQEILLSKATLPGFRKGWCRRSRAATPP
jgi:hypothetical protein